MKVLITGANGFVGTEIVELLREGDFEVYTTGRTENPKNAKKNYFAADITDHASLQKLRDIKKVDAVVHAAGLAHQFKNVGRDEFWTVNVAGTRNIARLAAELNAAQMVLISSVAVYGQTNAKTRSGGEVFEFEEDWRECRPRGFYAESKYEAERAARSECQSGGVGLTILRLATVVGEGDGGNVARLIRAIDKNRFLRIGDGKNLKSLIYKADAAAGCRKVLLDLIERKNRLENPNRAEIFNLTGAAVSMHSIVEKIAASLGKRTPPQTIIPTSAAQTILKRFGSFEKIKKISDTLEKWLSDEVFSGAKIKAAHGFEATTSALEALGREVEFYRQKKI